MANEYAVNHSDLKAVADAIRAKAGVSDALAFPAGFADAIAAIAADSAASGLAYDMGEWSIDADWTSVNKITVPHNLGDTPDFICVWTDHWAGITEAPYADGATLLGFVWLNDITGMTGRASSSADATNPIIMFFTMAKSDYRIGVAIASSASYGLPDDRLPTASALITPTLGASNLWRGGVVYKYFVSKAWWTIGGGADA